VHILFISGVGAFLWRFEAYSALGASTDTTRSVSINLEPKGFADGRVEI